MTPLDALTPFVHTTARALRAASFGRVARVGVAAAIALAAYCVGHAAWTGQPLQPALTVLWSSGHGVGIAALFGGAAFAARRRPRAAFAAGLGAGLACSGLTFAAGRALFDAAVGHGYPSVTLYLTAACALGWILWPRTPSAALTVDFGRTRERVPIERVVSARGARNYAELTLADDDRTGLVRTTLSMLEREFPQALVRTQRSWLVNPRHLRAIRHAGRGALVLDMRGGPGVPVSPSRAEALLRDPRFVPAPEDSSRNAGPQAPAG